jgi:hypothetical protein
MKFTNEADTPVAQLEEDSIHEAVLQAVSYKTFDWNDGGTKKTGEKLEWQWEITSSKYGPEFVGRQVRGECKPVMSNWDGNKFRSWAEALMGREIPVGMEIETDDLVGLKAEIVIGLRTDRKDPTKSWPFVADVIGSDYTPGGNSMPPF